MPAGLHHRAQHRIRTALVLGWRTVQVARHPTTYSNYIVGPLGSGKTRLALRLAEVLPSAAFLGLERVEDGSATARLDADPKLRLRVNQTLDWLVEEGATVSEALVALLTVLEAEGPTILIVDMVEHGLDSATQEAVAAHLRRRGSDDRPLFVLTRSCAILDLASVGAKESIILCPANHSPPTRVAPYPGAPGYEQSLPVWPPLRYARARKGSSHGAPQRREDSRERGCAARG